MTRNQLVIAICVLLLIGGSAAAFLHYRRRKRESSASSSSTNRSAMRYFNINEFDSPGEPGTGVNMQATTLRMLDKARGIAGVSFKINSGFRTPAHNAEVGGVSDSAHTRGYAADIAVTDATRDQILKSLYAVGFRRFGIGSSYVHADNDPSKAQNVVWYYPSTPAALKAHYSSINSIV